MNPRVGLNALFLHYPHSGTGRYLDQLIQRATSPVSVQLIGAAAFAPAGSWSSELVQLTRTPFDRRSRALAKVWFEQFAFPLAARQQRTDLAHYPYFAAPLRPTLPTICTVHDLATVLLPEYRRSAAQRLYASLASLGLRSARRIITDSAASAKDLITRLRISPTKIRVIPLAADARFRRLQRSEELAVAAELREGCGVRAPYLLYVGSFERRKNLDRLIGAYGQLKREKAMPHRLVLVGSPRPGHPSFYDPRPDIERLEISDDVLLAGARSDDEVIALLNGADAFVFPSRYEGFGLPPLEAMACGTPVLCSNASSLPEVVGDAGVLFDPRAVGELAAAIESVALDKARQEELSNRGLARARMFSWERTAAETVAAYQATLEQGP
jgi:glycosyltransferase involved in cell wall biosynthesis